MSGLETAKSLKSPPYEFSQTGNYWYRSESTHETADPEAGFILEKLRECSDVSLHSAEVQRQIRDWTTRFHLSSGRSNLLRPFSRLLKTNTLEIGCGCGAITRFLGELGGKVVAVEHSSLRAEAAAVRTRGLDNVTIVCDSASQLEWKGRFQAIVVTALGEHADGLEAMQVLLAGLKRLCAPEGCLILAVKNQMGLEQISSAASGIGKRQLTGLLENAGFGGLEWYLPLPSSQMATTLIYPAGYSGRYPSFNLQTFFMNTVFADAERDPSPLFSIEGAWPGIESNGLAHEFANSHLVLARGPKCPWPGAQDESTLVVHYGTGRRAEFLKEVRILGEENTLLVRKTRLLEGEPAVEGPYRMDVRDEEYVPGAVLSDGLVSVLNRPAWNVWDVMNWAEPWVRLLTQSVVDYGDMNLGQLLPKNYMDAVPFNLVIGEQGDLHWIDLEWEGTSEPELGFVMVRGFFWALGKITSVATPAETVPETIADIVVHLIRAFGFKCTGEDVRRYLGMEADFGAFVSGAAGPGEASGLLGMRLNIRPDPADLAGLSQTLHSLRSRIHEALSDIGAVRSDFSRQRNEIQEVAGRARAVEELQPHLKELESRIAQEGGAFHARVGELETRLEERDRQLQPRLSELDNRIAQESEVLHTRAAGLETRFEEQDRQIRPRFSELAGRIAQESGALRSRTAELETRLDERDRQTQPRFSELEGRIARESGALHSRAAQLEARLEEKDRQLEPRLKDLDERILRHGEVLQSHATEARTRFEEHEYEHRQNLGILESIRQQLGQIQETIAGQKGDLQSLASQHRESSSRLATVIANLTDRVQASLNNLDSRQAAVERSLPELSVRMVEAETRAQELDQVLQDCLEDLKALKKSHFAQSLRLEMLTAKTHQKIPSLTTKASVS